ncbi:hypothetical protein BCU17_12250 [Vibrio splendidus]|uniref:Cytolysin secretion protein n=1 Tax=Vibrio splendidus TaxID=29497 RepID=A0A2N7FK28_VIBSP|nr:hypothetical protein [Vibrio splendidus]PMJ69658.1 hypothetical protein BCU17_12250 [Vibrio splendidus]
MKKLILLLLFVSFSSRSDIRLFGLPTQLHETLLQKEAKNNYINNENINYINLASLSVAEIKQSKTLINENRTLIIDMTEVYSEEERISYSSIISGLGIDAPVIVVGNLDGEKIINIVNVNITDVNGNNIKNESEALESLSSSLVHVLKRFSAGMSL